MTENWWTEEQAADRLHRIEERIAEACLRAGRARGEVTLLAVTKTVEPERIRAMIAAGVRCVGENRVQEWKGKLPLWRETGVSVHLIGHLQTNKVRPVVGEMQCIESVDSLHLAQAIERAAAERGVTVPVLCEVNIGGEASKSGVQPALTEELLCRMAELPHLRVEGLMTVPPVSEASAEKRRYFEQMHKLFLDIKGKMLHNINMHTLSMGMSSDFEEAIAEGSTEVRIGTALFGARSYSAGN